MNDVNHLDSVIRPATEHTIPASLAETIVVVDASRKQVMDRVNLIDAYTRDLKYFLVSTTEDGQKVARAAIRLPYANGLPKDQKLSIVLRYQAGCKRGNEHRITQKLFDGSNPGVVFNDLLAKWTDEYLNARLDYFLEDYQHEKTSMETYIRQQASSEVGLELDIAVCAEGHDTLETVLFGPTVFRVRFNDCDEEENVEVRAALGVDEQRVAKTILNQTVSITDLVTKAVQGYFADRISLNAFYLELNDTGEPELKRYLNEALKSVGRKVVSISLDPQTDVPRSFKKDLELTISHLGYSEPIIVRSSVWVIPRDIVRYRAKRSPSLASWIEETLRDVVEEVLFDIEYLDLLSNFEPLEKNIKEEMRRRTEAIGFTLKQLITKPTSELSDRLRRISIKIDKDNSEGLFETSSPDCNIRLGITLTARINDLKGVSDRLKVKQDIPEEMKGKLYALIKQYVRAISPERFYSRYSHIDPQVYPSEIPVERELSDKIVSLLATEFDAEVTQLALESKKKEITDQLATLQRDSYDFKAAVPLGDFKGSGAFVMTGSFGVENVHPVGWKRFTERDSSIERIKKRIEDTIRAEMKARCTDLMLLRDRENITKLKDTLLSAIKKLILDEFGLVIDLTTVVCCFEGREEHGRRTTRLVERIAKLEEFRIDLLASGDDKNEIQRVEAQIATLKALLPP